MPAVRAARSALTQRGERTRRRLITAGEEVFGRRGFQFASIAEITQAAGVAQGTFYLYFSTKRDLVRAVVEERGHELRKTLAQATAAAEGRVAKEQAGFIAFFAWMARHRALYRVVRQVEYIDADMYRGWYRMLAEGYVRGLRHAAASGEIAAVEDAETLAYALMGVGDFVGMRWLVFEDRRRVPDRAVSTAVAMVTRALGSPPASPASNGRPRGGRVGSHR
jgi:AcrR family transcriptional regulator